MKVVFITHTLFHYRKRFHELVHSSLKQEGIDYSVIYGQPDEFEKKKLDTVEVLFGDKLKNRYIYINNPPLVIQPAMRQIFSSDLTILIQENRLLINYLVLSLPKTLRPKIAMFGHGRNFQSRNPDGRSEKWKAFWSRKPDWWFAYTKESASHVASLPFPRERITTFNNAIDTQELADQLAAVGQPALERAKRKIGIRGSNVGVYIGGLYPDKRLSFLVEAADLIRRGIPDFELVIVGSGPSESEIRDASSTRPWLHLTGPKFHQEKAEMLALARVFLMPGLVGLAVLDAGIAGLPLATTRFPWHSPEIAYLEDGVNGIITQPWADVQAYAGAVSRLLLDEEARTRMGEAAKSRAASFSIEGMAERFASGVKAALAAPKR